MIINERTHINFFIIIFQLLLIKAQNSDNNIINNIACDSNEDETFFFYENFNECILNECQEYPEISPGCMICKNHLSEYKKNKTCQRWRYAISKQKMVVQLAEDVPIKKMKMEKKLIILFAKIVLWKINQLTIMIII